MAFLSISCCCFLHAGPICSDGDVRLVSGLKPSFGRVQVCYHENWENVCSEKWGDNDATVVCRQLGFSNKGNS